MVWAVLSEGLDERGLKRLERRMVLDVEPFARPRPSQRQRRTPEIDTSIPGTNVAAMMAAMRTGRVG